MKTCPVCNSVAFDDATQCFGCMHAFDEPSRESPAAEEAFDAERTSVAPAESGAHFRRDAPRREAVEAVSEVMGAHGVRARSSAEITAPMAPIAPVHATRKPPEFFIRMAPALGRGGEVSWACSVELASA